MTLPEFAEALGDGVFCIDTGFHRPRFDAAYLVVDAGRAAFIDTGTNYAVPRLLATLQALGLARDAVDWVIPTHVHLDHAGGAGLLMHELPGARLLVHPRGLRHMVDPTALYNGALAVYGEAAMARDYGQLVAVDAARASRHARRHDDLTLGTRRAALCRHARPRAAPPLHLGRGLARGWFTGDTFGLSYREFDQPRGPLDPAQLDAGAVRPAGAARIGRAAAANEAPLHVPDALRPHRPGRALGRRLAGRAARHGGCRPGESARRRAPRPAARGPACAVPAIAARTWLRVPGQQVRGAAGDGRGVERAGSGYLARSQR